MYRLNTLLIIISLREVSPQEWANTKFKDRFFEDKDVRSVVKYDVKILKISPTEAIHTEYFDLVSPFWEAYCPNFLKYFGEDYITKLDGWQNYKKGRMPGTNSGLEGLNRSLKADVSEFTYMNFEKFLKVLIEDIEETSRKYETIKDFPKDPEIESEI